MKLTKCPNNHYYNADKLPYCPHCSHIESNIPVKDISGLQQHNVETVSIDRTASMNIEKRQTVGWLVCISGEMYGESFILYNGTNHIGRNPNMNVCLAKENTVSRNIHATITFDTQTQTFTLNKGISDKPVLVNNELSTETTPIVHHDVIQLGDCQLLFVALCGNEFSW